MTMRYLLFALFMAAILCAQNPETPVFPGAVATDTNLLVAKDNAWSTLDGGINDSTLTVVVTAGANFISPSVVKINSELLKVCSIVTNTLTICAGGRGFSGTTPAAHSSGALIEDVISAKHHNLVAAEIKAIETALGIGFGASIYNVLAYGADIADDSDSDSASLQAASDAAEAAGGGIVYLPKGTYNLSTKWLIDSPNIVVLCAGRGSILKPLAAFNTDTFIQAHDGGGSGASGFRMRGCTLNGNRANITDHTKALYGILLGSKSVLEDTAVYNFGRLGVGVYVWANDISIGPGNHIYSNGAVDDATQGGGNGILASGYAGDRASDIRIFKNHIYDNYDTTGPDDGSSGIALDALNVTIEDNVIYNNFNVGGGQITNLGDCGIERKWKVRGNTIYRNGNPVTGTSTLSGLELCYNGTIVEGNEIYGHAVTGTPAGIIPEAVSDWDVTDIVIANNYIHDNYTGIVLLDAGGGTGENKNITIANNRIMDNTVGLRIDAGSTGISVTGNVLVGNTTDVSDAATDVSYWGNQPVASVPDRPAPVTFATLGTPSNGSIMYCSDCVTANPCAGSGTGAIAKRLNGAWVCGTADLNPGTMTEIAKPPPPGADDALVYAKDIGGETYFCFQSTTGEVCIGASGYQNDSTASTSITGIDQSTDPAAPGANKWSFYAIAGLLKIRSGAAGAAYPLSYTLASGTATLGTSQIASTACASVVSVAATGAATTDTITWVPNADITAVTGYVPSTAGGLAIYPYPTSGYANFKICNPTSAAITPGAVTLNWKVIR